MLTYAREPFSLDSQDAKLLARYLTEDNTDEYIYFDAERVQEIEIVKSVIRKVIGRYDIFDEEEFIKVKQETNNVILFEFIEGYWKVQIRNNWIHCYAEKSRKKTHLIRGRSVY